MISYKCEWYGKTVSFVDTYYASSQVCSNCGSKNADIKNLTIRKWTCPACGEYHSDRDLNASINILRKIMVQIERAIRQTNSKIADLYKDVSDGLIDENDYLLMKTKFLNDKKQFEREEKLLSDNMKKTSDSAGKLRAADYLKKCKIAKKLDRNNIFML